MKTILVCLIFSHDVTALSADSFDRREQAEARLTRYAGLCLPLLDRSHACPERRRRARRIVARTIPSSYPPLALLTGKPLCEWVLPGEWYGFIGVKPTGEERFLGWLSPDVKAPGWWLVRYYGEKARTQSTWKDWHSVSDSREATRLLVADLLRVGIPPFAVRALVDCLRVREEAMGAPGKMEVAKP